jgi:hypothetical protein
MTTDTPSTSRSLREAVRAELLRLARIEEDVAASEAERVPYWEAMPLTVAVHRRCAAALRAAADRPPTAREATR